jgi:hypothetical protein
MLYEPKEAASIGLWSNSRRVVAFADASGQYWQGAQAKSHILEMAGYRGNN